MVRMVRRWAPAGVLMAALGACTSLPSPVVVPHTDPIPHLGIVGFFHGATPPMLAQLPPSTVLRAAVENVTEAQTVLASGFPILLLVEHADLRLVAQLLAVKDAPTLLGIELGNELDLAGLTPLQFGAFVRDAYDVLRRGGWTKDIISGGVYSVRDESIRYVTDAMAGWPDDIILGFHPYDALDDDTLGKLQALKRPLAATEYGMPSETPAEDQAQAAYLRSQTAMLQRGGFRYALIYQLLSCANTADGLCNFGVFRVDGSAKPGLDVLE